MAMIFGAFSKDVGKKTRTKVRRKKVKKKMKPIVIKAVKYQTGKRKSLSSDRKRKAMAPGKRRSSTGKIYWETRRNRSDLRGRKT